MVKLIGYSPREALVFQTNVDLAQKVDTVVRMLTDLGEECDLLLTLTDEDSFEEFSIAFSGSTLSLDFCPHKIRVVDYDLGTDEMEVIEEFDKDEINKATTWLVNKANQ